MPKGKKFPKLEKKVILNVGKPIYMDKYYNTKITKKLLVNLVEEVMKKISILAGKRYTR